MRLPALLRCCLLFSCGTAMAQRSPADSPRRFSFRNSFSLGSEWSNTSSHILLGVARNRRLGAFDLTFSHRVLDRLHFSWYTDLELRPLFFLQDPVAHDRRTFHRLHGV